MAAKKTLSVWCNAQFSQGALRLLQDELGAHRLLFSEQLEASNLAGGAPDPLLADADIAFGQPDPQFAMKCASLKWIHLTTAGYTRYDNEPFRTALKAREGTLTSSSHVYAEPCAEHVLAMMLAHTRQLLLCYETQRTTREWPSLHRRSQSRLLFDATVVMLGFGAIGRRLTELLAPFGAKVIALRRELRGDEGVEVVDEAGLARALARADHVVDLLPENDSTRQFVTLGRLAAIKRGGAFYNIGRGSTVDQDALLAMLSTGHLGAVYLDVTDPEPIPNDHRFWTTPNCFITPHMAGGHANEHERLVRHFLENLRRYENQEALLDRVV